MNLEIPEAYFVIAADAAGFAVGAGKDTRQ